MLLLKKQLLSPIFYLTASCRKFKLIKIYINKQKQWILIATSPDKGGSYRGNPEFSKTFLWNHVKSFLLSSELTSSLARYTLHIDVVFVRQEINMKSTFQFWGCLSRSNLQKKAAGFPGVLTFLPVMKLMYKTLDFILQKIPALECWHVVDIPLLHLE